MKKCLLLICLLALSACGVEAIKDKKPADSNTTSDAKAEEIALEVIKEFWRAFEEIDTAAPLEEKRAQLLPFLTEKLFTELFQGTEKPALPALPINAIKTKVTETSVDSFTIEHILPASLEDSSAIKQTISFKKQEERFVINTFTKENATLSLTRTEAEAFLAEQGYELTFIKEGSLNDLSILMDEAYFFQDVNEERIQMVINKETGYFTWLVKSRDSLEDFEKEAIKLEQIRNTYSQLFTHQLAEIDVAKLSAEQQRIYNTYIILPIEQAIDIDFDQALTNEEQIRQTKELLDQTVKKLLTEIQHTTSEKDFTSIQVHHEKWLDERQHYAEAVANVSGNFKEESFHAAYKEATEDYLAHLFYKYFYEE